jgi:anaerobic selenocysteine-containing dehydrogenase
VSALDRIGKWGREALLRKDGPLTRELLLEPGKFGIGRVPKRIAPDLTTTMVCGFCSTGCGLEVLLKNGEAVGLTPTADYPVNTGMACPKGWEALVPLRGPGRATTPLVKRNGKLVAATWDDALFEMADRFKAIQRAHGPASIAWLGTGQMPTEELMFLGALGKFGMGIVHGDGNTRQCMATSATAYKQSFGFDAPPLAYQDFEESDVIVLVGSNLCIAHPIMWERVCKNKHRPAIVVIDPRKTETAMAATHHYPIKPKSDLVLLYALANELILNGWIDQAYIDAHTTGFDDFRATRAPARPKRSSRSRS